MYKVLLADDEMLDLEGMKQFIPWSELGLEVVAAVSNGFSACEVLEQQKIDILVTDVNMPNMSGLELARIAIQKSANIRIIFVSGYQDFHYVKQALSLKACSYVLKPMDDNELIASLKSIIQELMEETRRKETEEQYQHLKPMAKNDLLFRLLEGEPVLGTNEQMKRLVSAYGLDYLEAPLCVSVLEIDELNLKSIPNERNRGHESAVTVHSFSDQSLQQLQEVIQDQGMHWCKLSRNRLAAVLHRPLLERSMEQMRTALNHELAVPVTIGLGGMVENIFQLSLSYKQALEALDGKMFFGRGQLIRYEDVRKAPELRDARTLDIRLDALFKAMVTYDLVRIHDEIDNLFLSVSTLRSKFTIYNLATYIIFKLDQYLHTLDEDLFEMLGMELDSLDVVLKFEMMEDIRSWLIRRVFEISEMIHQKEASKNSRLIREIMKIVKGRLHENITLKDIAQQFSFSPNYLGYLFKEEVGKSFSEVLITMRMERARELLKDPTLKIYEVADQVGYRYIPYFSKQFKETFGMTPAEYRKRE
ncbi:MULTISPECIES: response regulator [unclassified Paenibacillus]|uniref:response regulator n=1 Tax=unclassified Paenibacillus TaxID=185978 RepID=UPI000837ABED|nr:MULTISPECIES: response regulator [unclassified Paenibacillus]NWL87628.1 DNA-binding response regulator [Paenibacillus sp. 79R4]